MGRQKTGDPDAFHNHLVQPERRDTRRKCGDSDVIAHSVSIALLGSEAPRRDRFQQQSFRLVRHTQLLHPRHNVDANSWNAIYAD